MIINHAKLLELIQHPFVRPGGMELRREGSVFFVGGSLDPQETLGMVFASHCQQPADLVLIVFAEHETFHRCEEHARILKKNFSVHIMARFNYIPSLHLLERAYAAGIDLVDIPLHVFDPVLAEERGLRKEERLAALHDALAIFPAWGVTSTLAVGEEARCSTLRGVDALLKSGVVPLLELSPRAERYPQQEIEEVFRHLVEGLSRRKVAMKPLLPVLAAVTPLAPAKAGGVLKGFIDRFTDHRLLATSDLRRSLRVKQVEESFESAGL